MRLFLVMVVLSACCTPTLGITAPLPLALSTPEIIDISSLKPFLLTLSPDEREEQLRDWALYGLRCSLGLSSPGEMPIRHPVLTALTPGEVSPGRVFPLAPKEWGVVASRETIADKPMLGGLIDRRYATCNALPETISLFTYSVDPAFGSITLATAGSIKASDLFTPEYGYHSARLNNLTDFTNFIATIDDVVSCQWLAGSVGIGGRKYTKDGRRALALEDIAGLYQAFHPPGVPPSAAVDIGFSLDLKLNYPALGEDLLRIEQVPGVKEAAADPAFAALLSRHHADFQALGERLKKQHDLRPFQALQNRYAAGKTPAEARLRALLRYLAERHGYQTARYDGRLQGTSVAMILFYTDLLAKLWLLDYQGIAPSWVVGFRNLREIKLSRLYWDEFLGLPATRLWFGLRQEGFDLYGNKILFQPVISRVYAASFDPMFPGRESRPNQLNREFLGWWDTHYSALAAVEPYYHKLDQIQKWSCIFMVLQENKSPLLDFLQNVPVRRQLDFETWNRREAGESKINIPFYDRRLFAETTECLPLLASEIFPVLGRSYQLSGGVSLASRKDILAKIHRHGLGESSGSSQRRQTHPELAADASPARAPRLTPKMRSARAAARPTPATATEPRSAERNYGTFSAENEGDRIRLRWVEGPALAPYELVTALAARQEGNGQAPAGEDIFRGLAGVQSVVRLAEGKRYLLNTAAGRDQWLDLAINPARIAEYPAKAAAAFLTADIFGARLIPAASARKLAAGKPVVQ